MQRTPLIERNYSDPSVCPTCGGPRDHAPLTSRSSFEMDGQQIPVENHHPGPEYEPPITVYLKVTVPPGAYTRDDVVAAAAAAMLEIHPEDGGDPVVPTVAWSDLAIPLGGTSAWSDEAPRPAPLACGCLDLEEHREGVALQEQNRYTVPRAACVGCYLGDDGLSTHSCAIHPKRYWPKGA